MSLGFNPAFLSVGVENAVLPLIFLPVGSQPFTEESVQSGPVFGKDPFAPALVVAGKTSARQSKDFLGLAGPEDPIVEQVPIEDPDVPHPLRQGRPFLAFPQRRLRLLALADVADDPDDVALNERQQTNLIARRLTGRTVCVFKRDQGLRVSHLLDGAPEVLRSQRAVGGWWLAQAAQRRFVQHRAALHDAANPVVSANAKEQVRENLQDAAEFCVGGAKLFRTQPQRAFAHDPPGIELSVGLTDGLQEGTPVLGDKLVATKNALPLPTQQRVELFHASPQKNS